VSRIKRILIALNIMLFPEGENASSIGALASSIFPYAAGTANNIDAAKNSENATYPSAIT
jgi:hypothetical protein